MAKIPTIQATGITLNAAVLTELGWYVEPSGIPSQRLRFRLIDSGGTSHGVYASNAGAWSAAPRFEKGINDDLLTVIKGKGWGYTIDDWIDWVNVDVHIFSDLDPSKGNTCTHGENRGEALCRAFLVACGVDEVEVINEQ